MEKETGVSDTDLNESGSTKNDNLEDTVSYETHKKLLGQRKADQEKYRTVETELEMLRSAAAEKERVALEEQGNYKEIVNLRDKELAATKEELVSNKKLLIDGAKMQAFKEKVGGSFKKSEYASFVNLDKIVLMSDGTFDEASLESTVNNFLKEHGDNLLNRSSNKKLPNEAGSNGQIITKTIPNMGETELKNALTENLKLLMTN